MKKDFKSCLIDTLKEDIKYHIGSFLMIMISVLLACLSIIALTIYNTGELNKMDISLIFTIIKLGLLGDMIIFTYIITETAIKEYFKRNN